MKAKYQLGRINKRLNHQGLKARMAKDLLGSLAILITGNITCRYTMKLQPSNFNYYDHKVKPCFGFYKYFVVKSLAHFTS
jgi:hypothetical protein